jgi:hypothetical protein
MIQINYFQGSKLSLQQQIEIENTARTMAQIKSLPAIAKMQWPISGLSVEVGITEIQILRNNQPVATIRGDWHATHA